MAYSIGMGTTLADVTRVPAAVWSTPLFLVCLYVLSRGSLTTTVASALVIGALNIGLVVLISVLMLGHLNPANFAYVNVPGIGGRPFRRLHPQPGVRCCAAGVLRSPVRGQLRQTRPAA